MIPVRILTFELVLAELNLRVGVGEVTKIKQYWFYFTVILFFNVDPNCDDKDCQCLNVPGQV